MSCPFCARIERGQFTLTPLYPVVSFEPLHPVTPGHRLFLPREHVEYRVRIPRQDPNFTVADCMDAAARWALICHEDFNLITSSGPDATQSVPHIHIHYVPRRTGDGLHLPWTDQPKPPGELGPMTASGLLLAVRRERDAGGCCSTCDGQGMDAASAETGGRCWDCYGTGHVHQPDQDCPTQTPERSDAILP